MLGRCAAGQRREEGKGEERAKGARKDEGRNDNAHGPSQKGQNRRGIKFLLTEARWFGPACGVRDRLPSTVRIDIGTSGYGYKEWVGTFYPAGLKPKAMLAHYATKLSCVEINYTFRRMPTAKLLEGWAGQVPEDFTFVLKAPERITHRAKLKDVAETTEAFVTVAQTLGPRLGALLFQLPPYAKKDVAVLRTFLAGLAARVPVAFEFRHPSWLEDDSLAVLREHGAALCLSESDDATAGDELRGAPDFHGGLGLCPFATHGLFELRSRGVGAALAGAILGSRVRLFEARGLWKGSSLRRKID